MGEQIVAGLAVAAVVGLFGLIWKTTPSAWRRLRARLSTGRVAVTGSVHAQLMDGMGEANLVDLLYASPEQPQQSTLFVEIETPDEQRVWSINVPLGYKMSDLALAARSYFKLRPAFFRLTNKARQVQAEPNDDIETAAKAGDRLKMTAYKDVWGWEIGGKRRWLRAFIDRLLGVKVIKRLGPGGE